MAGVLAERGRAVRKGGHGFSEGVCVFPTYVFSANARRLMSRSYLELL